MRGLAVALLLVGCGDDGGVSSTETGTSIPASSSGASTAGPSTSSTADTSSSTGADALEVEVVTTLGSFVVALDEEAAPATVANFLAYTDAGFYDGSDGAGSTLIHRVQPGRLVQGGGLLEDLAEKPTMAPVVNEAGNGLLNVRGAIGMARIPGEPDSATSQFFVNLVDNPALDEPPGFAVFGSVVEGMSTIDAMAMVATESVPPLEDVPVDPIVITSLQRRDP